MNKCAKCGKFSSKEGIACPFCNNPFSAKSDADALDQFCKSPAFIFAVSLLILALILLIFALSK
jgi:hypothetical protein